MEDEKKKMEGGGKVWKEKKEKVGEEEGRLDTVRKIKEEDFMKTKRKKRYILVRKAREGSRTEE